MRHTTRWSYALRFAAAQAGFAAIVGGASWLLVGLVLGDGLNLGGLARVLPVLVVIYFLVNVGKLKSPQLQIETDRLVVWRGGAQITLLFADFDSVGKQSYGPLSRESLEFRTGMIESAQPGKRLPGFLEDALRKQKADRTLVPAQFFADWRTSALGSVVPGGRQ